MASEFRIQIVREDSGRVVSWAPGLEVEQNFVKMLRVMVQAKSVGRFVSREAVGQAVEDAANELLTMLKAQV